MIDRLGRELNRSAANAPMALNRNFRKDRIMSKQGLLIGALLIGALQFAAPAVAQNFPLKQPIRLVVPVPAGGVTDAIARVMADFLGKRIGQSVVVENRPGAASTIGTDFVAKSLSVEVVDGAGKGRKVVPVEPVPEDVQPLLQVLVPAMGAAMGNLGRTLHFFVFQDLEKDARVFSPFDSGAVVVKLSGRENRQDISLSIERPVDSLLVPRLCANGKPAHVTWKFCPWDGKKLPD